MRMLSDVFIWVELGAMSAAESWEGYASLDICVSVLSIRGCGRPNILLLVMCKDVVQLALCTRGSGRKRGCMGRITMKLSRAIRLSNTFSLGISGLSLVNLKLLHVIHFKKLSVSSCL